MCICWFAHYRLDYLWFLEKNIDRMPLTARLNDWRQDFIHICWLWSECTHMVIIFQNGDLVAGICNWAAIVFWHSHRFGIDYNTRSMLLVMRNQNLNTCKLRISIYTKLASNWRFVKPLKMKSQRNCWELQNLMNARSYWNWHLVKNLSDQTSCTN